jgi:hypothetical protein
MAQKKQRMRSSRALRPAPLDASEKAVIVAAREAFIGDVLKPRFLPQIRPADAMELCDRHPWRVGGGTIPLHAALQVGHGAQSRRRAQCALRPGPDRFDIYWMRHTGKWWCLHLGVTLAEALRILETDGVLHPV